MNINALRRGLDGYEKSSLDADIVNANPHRLIQALMDGCLTALNKAKGAAQNNNLPMRSEQTSRAVAILGGLLEGINPDEGGPIAVNLMDLYLYMQTRLMDAVAKSDVEAYDEVSGLLRQVKQGWDGIPASYHHGMQHKLSA